MNNDPNTRLTSPSRYLAGAGVETVLDIQDYILGQSFLFSHTRHLEAVCAPFPAAGAGLHSLRLPLLVLVLVLVLVHN